MLRPALQRLLTSELALNNGASEFELNGDSSRAGTPDRSIHSSGSATPESERKMEAKGQPENWDEEKGIYEMQLTQLQEQLVETMLENQQLATEIKNLKERGVDVLKKDLEEERKRRKKLEDQMRKQKPKRPPRPFVKKSAQQLNEYDSEMDFDDLAKDLEALSNDEQQSVSKFGNGKATPLSESDGDGAKEEIACEIMDAGKKLQPRQPSRLLTFKIAAWNFIHERISDFICEDDSSTKEEEEEPLAVKKLRENVSRFTSGIEPIKAFIIGTHTLLSWKNPWKTLSAFLIYMYSVWLGLFVPMIFLLAIIKLTLNFLYAKGISQKFGFYKKKEEKEEQKEESTSWSERYQLVLQIARKVQNTLGDLADGLEKFESLFFWHHEEASKKLYTFLCVGFVFSLLLSTRIFFLLIGLGLGCKMFLVTPIYNRFPKVKHRYDDIDRLWDELPTHVDLESRREEASPEKEEMDSKRANDNNESARRNSKSDNGIDEQVKGKPDLSWESIVFCDRFQLPSTELPLPGWQEGRRCTLLNKENPLSNMKHGRLYLTKHYLCFERNQYHSKKNSAFQLHDILNIAKSKPIGFLPGSGMAIEVKVKDYEKPFIFGAMMARDEAYESILSAGKALNLSWSKKSR